MLLKRTAADLGTTDFEPMTTFGGELGQKLGRVRSEAVAEGENAQGIPKNLFFIVNNNLRNNLRLLPTPQQLC